jgi:hypothetical protein
MYVVKKDLFVAAIQSAMAVNSTDWLNAIKGKKERQYETQITTKIGSYSSYSELESA